jgi:hypothetical protein
MNDLDYKLYVLAELNYKKSNPDVLEENLYPDDWFSINNYRLKNEIIAEAIRDKKLIKDTQKYQQAREDVRKSH